MKTMKLISNCNACDLSHKIQGKKIPIKEIRYAKNILFPFDLQMFKI